MGEAYRTSQGSFGNRILLLGAIPLEILLGSVEFVEIHFLNTYLHSYYTSDTIRWRVQGIIEMRSLYLMSMAEG